MDSFGGQGDSDRTVTISCRSQTEQTLVTLGQTEQTQDQALERPNRTTIWARPNRPKADTGPDRTDARLGPDWTDFGYPGPNRLKHEELHREKDYLCVSKFRPKHYLTLFWLFWNQFWTSWLWSVQIICLALIRAAILNITSSKKLTDWKFFRGRTRK